MPSISMYRELHKTPGHPGIANKPGEARKEIADIIEDQTWWQDIDSRVAYLYDYYHDDENLTIHDLHPQESETKVPIDIKFITHTDKTYNKDTVTVHMEFRPKQECNIDYYDEVFSKRYKCTWPLGLYVDIPDRNGIYHKWLVVDLADYHTTQFAQYEILPCDRVYQWMMDGKKMQMCGVTRSQNSYNKLFVA